MLSSEHWLSRLQNSRSNEHFTATSSRFFCFLLPVASWMRMKKSRALGTALRDCSSACTAFGGHFSPKSPSRLSSMPLWIDFAHTVGPSTVFWRPVFPVVSARQRSLPASCRFLTAITFTPINQAFHVLPQLSLPQGVFCASFFSLVFHSALKTASSQSVVLCKCAVRAVRFCARPLQSLKSSGWDQAFDKMCGSFHGYSFVSPSSVQRVVLFDHTTWNGGFWVCLDPS